LLDGDALANGRVDIGHSMPWFIPSMYWLAVALYGTSIRMVAYLPRVATPEYDYRGTPGWTCLLFGWLAILDKLRSGIPWVANLFFFATLAGWLLPFGKQSWFQVVPWLGFACSLLALRVDRLMISEGGDEVAVRAAAGAWVWIASFLVLSLAASLRVADAGRTGRV
jgi:hypothetical protein